MLLLWSMLLRSWLDANSLNRKESIEIVKISNKSVDVSFGLTKDLTSLGTVNPQGPGEYTYRRCGSFRRDIA
jgi:hypothetical protein